MFILKSKMDNSLSLKHNPKFILFADDNFYIDNQDYTIISEGYYLNDNPPSIEDISNLDYASFSKKYIGSYSLAYYDKKTGIIKIYNDRLSKKFVFYYSDNQRIIVSTSYLDIVDYAKANNLRLSVDEKAQSCFFEFGCFESDFTYVNEIKCLYSYQYIEIDQELSIKTIDVPSFKAEEFLCFDKVVEKTHNLFVQAISRIINKNQKYNKTTLVSLSGGMDSRIAFFETYNQLKNNFLCYCYAQSKSKDHTISSQIASDYGVKYFFYPLDGGEFVLQRPYLMQKNDMQMYYCGATGIYECIKQLPTDKLGIVVLGINGGEIFGDVVKVGDESTNDDYKNLAIRKNLEEIRCCENSTYTISDIAESAAPFLDEDLFEYLMSVPYSYKVGKKLYIELFKKFYDVRHETTTFKAKIGNPKNYFASLINHIQETIFKKGRYSMNPFDYWWKKDSRISSYVMDGFNSDISFLKSIGIITDNIVKEFNNSSIVEKIQIFSYTGALVRIFKNTNNE